MKIALPVSGNEVNGHFGHCESFKVFTANDKNEIVAEELIKAPAGCGCKSNIVQTLAQMGVEVMLAGNMGEGAVNVLQGFGIKVIRGCSGDVTHVVRNWLAGRISDSGTACHEHQRGCPNG